MKGPTDIGDISPRRYFAVVAVVVGLLLALVAGDADDGRGWLLSLLQWQFQACVPMALMLLAHRAWSRVRRFETSGPWSQLLVSGLTGCLLFTPLALLIDVWLEEPAPAFAPRELLNELVNVTPPITLTWLAINAPFVLGLRLRAAEEARDAGNRSDGEATDSAVPAGRAGPDGAAMPHFFSLVPPALRGELLYLQAELHYLAVITDRGRSLILYNLRDAVRELEGLPGLAVHRSYWVNLEHIRDFRRAGRQGQVSMSNGDRVPVSRRRLGELQGALEARPANA